MIRRLASFLLLLAGLSGSAVAHEARPLSVEMVEQKAGDVAVSIVVPGSISARNRPLVRFTGCGEAPVEVEARARLACPAGAAGVGISIRYPLVNPSVATLIQLRRADGETLVELLPPETSGWTVPEAPDAFAVAGDYFRLGVEHIWFGFDHLLFVAGLMVLAGTWQRVLLTVTGFTLAHSLTLALAALGLVRVAVPPTEAAIALSILFLARELARPDDRSLARRFPLAVSASFGLLHGFGFAAVLGEIGLPSGHLVTGLLFFNVGVEIGQIAFLLVLALALGILRLLAARPTVASLAHAGQFPTYAIGILAAFWFFERLAAFA